ncbi:hypothetical protein MSPP1_002523 [Malassezia sp. CBS 17886]|nr:hypothetical protein MSPP1_002523 [Malassezia sp. CBS 17886]
MRAPSKVAGGQEGDSSASRTAPGGAAKRDRVAEHAPTVAADIAAVRAAVDQLECTLTQPPLTPHDAPRDATSPDALPAAYRALERKYAALAAQYAAERKSWLAFKRWWRARIAEKRRRRRGTGAAPFDPPQEFASSATTGTSPPPDTYPGGEHPRSPPPAARHGSPPLATPASPRRRNREHILQHRARIQDLLRTDPDTFRRAGRYQTKRERRPAPGAQDAHAGGCACCRDYYEMVADVAPAPRAVWASPSAPTDETRASPRTRRRYTSRHRAMTPPDPTPPDYWELSFPNTQDAHEINERARA